MRIFVFSLLLFAWVRCKEAEKNFDYGKIENGVYTNDYFDFNIPVPQNWDVRNDEQVQQLQKKGSGLISGNNKELEAKIDQADVNTVVLLTVFKNKEDTTAVKFNPSFILLCENLQGSPDIKKGKDYLDHAKYLMQQSKMPYQFTPEYFTEKVGNKEFDRMDAVLDGQMGGIQQSYYSIIDKGYALSIIISFVDADQKIELKGIINKIKFK
jgi:hypothetical protein